MMMVLAYLPHCCSFVEGHMFTLTPSTPEATLVLFNVLLQILLDAVKLLIFNQVTQLHVQV